MKVAVVSHSYLEPENQKNIAALNSYCDVRCVLQKKGSVLLFNDYKFQCNSEAGINYSLYNSYSITKAQYFLLSTTLELNNDKPDVIVVEYNPWSIIFLQVLLFKKLYCRKAKIVCMIKKNTYRTSGFRGYLKKWLTHFGLSQVDHFIAASHMASNLLTKQLLVDSSKVTVCHHLGVDTDLFQPKASEDLANKETKPIVIGYCGRFDMAKGIKELVESVKIVIKNSDHPISLKLMGCGAYADPLDSYLADEAKKNSWLEILPPVENAKVAAFLQEIDIFVLPSRILEDHQEHDAHVLLEALSVGVPCIATKSGINSEILRDGIGVLVNPQSPEELATVISMLILDTKKREQMTIAGRKNAEHEFSLDVIAAKKTEIFRAVLDERKKIIV